MSKSQKRRRSVTIGGLPISRRAQDKLRGEIKEARTQVEHSEGLRRQLHEQLGQSQRLLENHSRTQSQLNDRILVLEGDRDRLTAALDVCVRRLSSPLAERDILRGGWRGRGSTQSLQDQQPYEQTKDDPRAGQGARG